MTYISGAMVPFTIHNKEELKKKARDRPKEMTDEEWVTVLSPEQYHVRQGGTERPWTGCYNEFREEGIILLVHSLAGPLTRELKRQTCFF